MTPLSFGMVRLMLGAVEALLRLVTVWMFWLWDDVVVVGCEWGSGLYCDDVSSRGLVRGCPVTMVSRGGVRGRDDGVTGFGVVTMFRHGVLGGVMGVG